MSVSVNEFWNRIATTGIADADDCRAMAVDFAQAYGGQPPADARSLARHLVQTERLTGYQAKQLLANDVPPANEPANGFHGLRIGEFVVTEPMSQPPFRGWFWGRPSGSEQPASLLFPLEQRTDADRRWLLSHQTIEASHLQPVELSGWETATGKAGGEFVISRLPAGQSLAEMLKKNKRLDEPVVRRIGLSIGHALKSLHDGGIIHGDVHPERVWIGNDRTVWLLRDATGPATPPFENRPGWFHPLQIPALYAAPEFSLPGQVADPLTDQYALGCLLWHLRTGERPHPATDTDALIRQHTAETPEPLRRAVQAGAAGDPLMRVIAHAMSKNAEARFRDTGDLIAALEAIPANAKSPARKAKAPVEHAPAMKGDRSSEPKVSDVPPPAIISEAPAAVSAQSDPEPQAKLSASATSTPVPVTIAPRSGADKSRATLKTAPLVVDTAAKPSVTHPLPPASPKQKPGPRRRKKNRKAPLMIGGLGFLVMILMVLVLVTRNGTGPASDPSSSRPRIAYQPPPPSIDGRRSTESVTSATSGFGDYTLVNDDQTLWLPPSVGEAPPLRMIPPGPQMVVSLRLRQIFSSPAGKQMLAAIDPELADTWDRLETRTGVPAEQIERLTIALEGAGDGYPSAALGVELAAPIPLNELQERWNAEPARTPEGVTVFAGESQGADAYFVAGESFADDTPVDAFAVGTLDQIKLVAELEGGSIPLPRSLERLWRSADSGADLIVLGSPNFLFADGRQMLDRFASEAVEPLKEFLLPDVAGMMVSSTLQPQWYVEVRLTPGARTSAAELVQQLKTSVQQLPQWAEQFLIKSSPDASWRALALRLPQMMFAVSDHARFGISDDAAVGNLYLPEVAAPNVTLATLLAANTPHGRASVATTARSDEPALTLEQMLERPMSIRFDQEALEVAANSIIDEFSSDLPPGTRAPEIFVIGGDLEEEGITQNQQIREFDLRDQKLRTVLTELVLRGNPVTTVESPTEVDQKLVWVVGPHPEASDQQAILVTTRAAAEGNYTLPTEFVAP